MDNWANLNAATLLPGVMSQLEDIKGRLLKTSAALGSMNAAVNIKAEAAIGGIELGTTIIDKINALNCAVLIMNPTSGDLVQRINTATNQPPYGDFSAGIVIGMSGQNLEDIKAQFETLMDAIKGVSVEKMAVAEINSAWSWKK